MAHMLAQRIATTVMDAYRARDDAATELTAARACRRWLEGLALDPAARAGLVEPIAAVEAGLAEVLRRRERDAGP